MKGQKVIFDIETTGLNPEQDEILQFSAINENGEVLLNTYMKPTNHTDWKDAETIHHISPEMVSHCKTMEELLPDIQVIFDNCSEAIAYNFDFDFSFLFNAGIKFRPGTIISDPMIEFAEIYGEWNDYYGNYKWKKLTIAAYYYGYNFDDSAHDSLEDAKATLVVYNAIKNALPPYMWLSTQLLNKKNEVVFESADIVEVCDKANDLFGNFEINMINRYTKNGFSFEYFLGLNKN